MTRVSQAVFPVVPCSWGAIPAQYPEWLCGRELPTAALHCGVKRYNCRVCSSSVLPCSRGWRQHCIVRSAAVLCIVPFHFRCWYEAGTEVQLEPQGWCWLLSTSQRGHLPCWRGDAEICSAEMDCRLQTRDMQGKDADDVDLGHKLQLDLYS